MSEIKRISYDDWKKEAVRLFGSDHMKWKFVCPACKHIASAQDYRDFGAGLDDVGYNCIGRYMDKCRDAFGGRGKGPCNYTLGGLIRLQKTEILSESLPALEFCEGAVQELRTEYGDGLPVFEFDKTTGDPR